MKTKIMKKIKQELIDLIVNHDIKYTHSKSWGHGGQNVNKRHTKAEWYFDILQSKYLDEDQKNRLLQTYHNHVNHDWVFRMTSQKQRNYHQNLTELQRHRKAMFQLLWDESVFEYLHHHGKRRKRKKHAHKKRH